MDWAFERGSKAIEQQRSTPRTTSVITLILPKLTLRFQLPFLIRVWALEKKLCRNFDYLSVISPKLRCETLIES